MTEAVLVVKVAGDSTSAQKALSDTASSASKSSSSIKKSFSAVGSALQSALGEALGPTGQMINQLQEGFSGLAEKGATLGEKLAGIGAAGVGIGSALMLAGSGDKSALAQLQASVSATGESFSDYKGQVDKVADSMTKYGYNNEQVYNALQTGVQATGSMSKSLGLMGTAANLAAAQHEDLGSAMNQLVQIVNGKGTKTLREFGIVTTTTGNSVTSTAKALTSAQSAVGTASDALTKSQMNLQNVEASLAGKTTLTTAEQNKLTAAHMAVSAASDKLAADQAKLVTAQDNAKNAASGNANEVQQLADKLKGQASAASDTFEGRLKSLRAEVENHIAEIGQKYGPTITTASGILTGMGGAISVVNSFTKKGTEAAKDAKEAQEALTASKEAATVATDTEAASTDALAASEDAEAVSAAAAETASIPIEVVVGLIAAGVIALGVVVYELYTNWKTVFAFIQSIAQDAWKFIDGNFIQPLESAFNDVVSFITSNWKTFTDILLGPIGLIITNWNTITGFFQNLFKGVWDWVNSNFVHPIEHMFDGITGFFTSAWDDAVSFIEQIPQKILGFFSGLGGAIKNIFLDIVNFPIKAIDAVISDVNSVYIPGMPHISPIPTISGFWQGGVVTQPTLAMVGERGPEAVVPLPGSAGFNNPSSSLSGLGGVNTTNHINVNVSSQADPYDIGHELTWAMKTQIAA